VLRERPLQRQLEVQQRSMHHAVMRLGALARRWPPLVLVAAVACSRGGIPADRDAAAEAAPAPADGPDDSPPLPPDAPAAMDTSPPADAGPPLDGPAPTPDAPPPDSACPIPCLAELTRACPVQLPCTVYNWSRGTTTCYANGPRVIWGPPMKGPQGYFYGASLYRTDNTVCYMIEQPPLPDRAPFTYRDAAGNVVGRGTLNPDGTMRVTCADGQVFEAPPSLDCPGPKGPEAMCRGGPVCG
jgi:hypothetical protein